MTHRLHTFRLHHTHCYVSTLHRLEERGRVVNRMIHVFIGVVAAASIFWLAHVTAAADPPIPLSEQTEECIACHSDITPGIVQDWRSSRHARTTPQMALTKPPLERRISAEIVDQRLQSVVVGCYECHSLNPERHRDHFEHFDYGVNVIVSPNDCKTCHPVEVDQYSGSKKAHALGNLIKNPVYSALVETILSVKEIKDGRVSPSHASEYTKWETCLGCHGTEVTVKGTKEVSTELGDITVPDLENWPNQGVGRINPDGSRGACSSCHPRHAFSIEVARKPYTCAQCHLDPDVPAWNVYKESKHGNIFFSQGNQWNWDAVPWTVGSDFKTPTCAVCHSSLIVSPEGEEIVPRTHDFGARLWVRLFGLIYSHPQPKAGDTSLIQNPDGLSLPTTFTGALASEYLISKEEQQRRQAQMKAVCGACHSTSWVNGHFRKMDHTVAETDKMILAATRLLLNAWEGKLADKTHPFDEHIEQKWIRQWLFYSNSIRYASAMTGAPDYATFKLGWWELTLNLREMEDWIHIHRSMKR